ncbi:hypothetical protein ATK23_2389 [Glutamicibacter mysorens]|uniref:Uncharacterized protein n=1 Tax=Glutamicibacter mysorens TaxID=257984 RepID=A0ABX4N000_9MICC|nr:hypothetical protein [Glutamicibacter mysorens]PJJ45134.1 hypothetical protein ATK23_2389 [Glutamicibacter mysorens]
MGTIHEYTPENPQGTDSERKWHSVLLAYPFHAGSRTLQSGGFLAFEAEKQRKGLLCLNHPHVHEYVARWIAAGFTPELYWAVSAGLKAALEHARELCRNFEDQDRLEQRLELLGIKAKNPQAGQTYLRVTGKDPDTGRSIMEERAHPEHIVQLVPEAWAEFPRLLCFERPSVALSKYIRGNYASEVPGSVQA